MKPLLPLHCFEPVFLPFKNKKIGFVLGFGNVGDYLIEDSARQLFKKFNIESYMVNNRQNPGLFDLEICQKVDEFVFNGGGSMGSLYPENREIRRRILEFKKPFTVLPQSFFGKEDFNYKKVWVRETDSFKFSKNAQFAPDLALGYEFEGEIPEAEYETGIWMREDIEASNLLK